MARRERNSVVEGKSVELEGSRSSKKKRRRDNSKVRRSRVGNKQGSKKKRINRESRTRRTKITEKRKK